MQAEGTKFVETIRYTLRFLLPFFSSSNYTPILSHKRIHTMKHSLTTIALGALLLSQSVLAGLYSSKDNVIDVTPKNFQAEVMDSNVRFRSCLLHFFCFGIEQGQERKTHPPIVLSQHAGL